MKDLLYRSHEFRARGIDEAARTATFVAATETGVDGWFGREYLRVGGIKLDRYQGNPVFLDCHQHYESGAVIGRCEMTVEGRELVAVVTYAATERATEIWDLVRTGFLRAVSVGFMPSKYRELAAGEVDGEGESRVEGPGLVILESELYELSQCPIPADRFALLRRSLPAPFGAGQQTVKNLIDYSRLVTFAGVPALAKTGTVSATDSTAAAAPAQPAATTKRAEGDDGEGDGADMTAEEARKELAEACELAVDASWDEIVAAVKELQDDEEAEGDEAAAEPKSEKALRILGVESLELRRREILAIAPPSLRELAEKLVLDDVDVEAARRRLLEEYARRSAPVGTPEPPQPKRTKPSTEKDTQARVLGASDDVFARAFVS